MSENLETVKSFYYFFNNKSFKALRASLDENIVWTSYKDGSIANKFIGIRELFQDLFKPFNDEWEYWNINIDDYIDSDSNTIVAIGVCSGKLKVFENSASTKFVHVFTIDNNLITKIDNYDNIKMFYKVFNEFRKD